MPGPSLPDEKLIEAVEAVNSRTPSKKVEGLVLQIGTRIRNRVPVPPSESNYDKWEWVWFEIYRNLKKEISDLRG